MLEMRAFFENSALGLKIRFSISIDLKLSLAVTGSVAAFLTGLAALFLVLMTDLGWGDG
jgi:hypothetical protein